MCQWNRPVLHIDDSGRHKMFDPLPLNTVYNAILPSYHFFYIYANTYMYVHISMYVHIYTCTYIYLYTPIDMYIHKNHTQNMDINTPRRLELKISQKNILCNMNLLLLSFLPSFATLSSSLLSCISLRFFTPSPHP